MSARFSLPYHRQGTAGGTTYTAVIRQTADGWRWEGHQAITGSGGTDFGPQMDGGGPYKTEREAAAFADEWFYSIEEIVESPSHRPLPTITPDNSPSAGGIADRPKKKPKK